MEETRKLIICRGIQGSGKTTWAKQWCHEDPEHRVRFNNDDIRNTLGDYWIPSREKLVKALYEEFLSYSMAHGYDIVIDNMNLNLRTTSAIVEEVNLFNRIAQGKYEWKYVVEFKDFWTPVEEDNSRWCGYEIGDNTNAFHSPEDVIALAKEVCKARFKGNWILKIVDYSGKDLDEEILIDKL